MAPKGPGCPAESGTMSVDYQSIIDAIDAAVLSWVGEPVKLSFGHGEGDVEYRSMKDLREAREYYSNLLKGSQTKRPFRLLPIRPGGSR